MIWIFLLIYFVSLLIHIIVCYRENKRVIYKVGDLIDLIDFYMWFPLLNTFIILGVTVMVIIMAILRLTKLDVLWNKFRNIKL